MGIGKGTAQRGGGVVYTVNGVYHAETGRGGTTDPGG